MRLRVPTNIGQSADMQRDQWWSVHGGKAGVRRGPFDFVEGYRHVDIT
jgi:hypothetical protein